VQEKAQETKSKNKKGTTSVTYKAQVDQIFYLLRKKKKKKKKVDQIFFIKL
jgi:hypothetical protein